MSDSVKPNTPARDYKIIAVCPKPSKPLPKFNKRREGESVHVPPFREKFFVAFKTNHPRIGRVEVEAWGVDREEAYSEVVKMLNEPFLIAPDIN